MSEQNTNCLNGMKCPKCGALEPFKIAALCWVVMTDEGSEQVTNLEWDKGSSCECLACHFAGPAMDFG